jgi:predicted nucleic acid-binding Zn finger protein
MVTAFNILYSAAAARRLLGLQSSAPVQIREFFKVVWVWVKGQRPTFISKAVFKAHFADWRRSQARGLKVTERLAMANHYTVRNLQKATAYVVEKRPDGLFCTCDDLNNQLEFFGRGCCKHGYAVLAHLGFSSLKDYLDAQKVIPFPKVSDAPAAYAA